MARRGTRSGREGRKKGQRPDKQNSQAGHSQAARQATQGLANKPGGSGAPLSKFLIPTLANLVSGYKAVLPERSLLSTMPTMDVILDRYPPPEAYLQSMQLHSSAEYFLATPGLERIFMHTYRYPTPEAYLKSMQLHSSAEYFLAMQEGRMEAHLQGRASWRKYSTRQGKAQLRVEGVDFEDEPWVKSLLEVQGCGYAIFAYSSNAPEGVRTFGFCNIKPQDAEIPKEGYVRCLGYVGSHIMEFSSAGRMLSKMPAPGSASRWLLEAVASPGTHPSSGTPPHVSTLLMGRKIIIHNGKVPVNQAQEHAVRHLRPGLDTIHGPPGTGKSTTIYHIVASRVKKRNKTLVTCTRNQAVNAVVDKVSGFGCVVFGNPKRLGIDSLRYTLKALIERDPIASWWNAMSCLLGQAKDQLKCHHDMSMYGPCMKRLAGIEKDIEGQPLAKRKACGRWLLALQAVIKDIRWAERIVEALCRVKILNNSRVFLSTVEATASMNREVIEAFDAIGCDDVSALKIDTCIVDEAGSVLESAIPVLLFWEPANLVLVGDHCQLPPFSHVREEIAEPLKHARSLLERCVDAGMVPWFLETQYRMHPRLSGLVSRLFYKGRLMSAPPTQLPRPHPRPCLWVQCQGAEKGHPGGGISNPKEVIAVVKQAELVVASGRYPLSFVISFYNKQKEALQKLFEAKPILAKALKAGTLLVLSVDACQGSEADCVIISPVRTKKVSSFGKSKHRLCVALSGAKHDKGGDLWRQITGHFVAGINPGLIPAVSPGIGLNPGHGSGSSARAAGATTATGRPTPAGSGSSAKAAAASTAPTRPRGSGSSARAAEASTATSRPGGSGVPSPSHEANSMQVAMSRMMMMSLEKLDDETGGGPMPAGPVTKHPGPSTSRVSTPSVKMLRAAFEAGAGSKSAGPGPNRTCPSGPGPSRPGPPGTGPNTSRVPTPSVKMLRAAYEAGAGSKSAGPGTSRPATKGPGPSRPVTAGPGTSRPVTTTGPGTSQPGTTGPGPSCPATTGPGTSSPATTAPSTSQPATTGPGPSQPGTTGPSPSQPATTGPGPSQPGTTGPIPSQPATTGPGPSRPVTPGPGTSQPGTTGPGPSCPATTAPSTSLPVTASPGTRCPATTAPSTSLPVTAGPGTSRPATTAPSTSLPVTAGPGPSCPATTAPSTSLPVTAGPGPSCPATTGPSTSLPITTGHGTSRPATTVPGPSCPGPAGPGSSSSTIPTPSSLAQSKQVSTSTMETMRNEVTETGGASRPAKPGDTCSGHAGPGNSCTLPAEPGHAGSSDAGSAGNDSQSSLSTEQIVWMKGTAWLGGTGGQQGAGPGGAAGPAEAAGPGSTAGLAGTAGLGGAAGPAGTRGPGVTAGPGVAAAGPGGAAGLTVAAEVGGTGGPGVATGPGVTAGQSGTAGPGGATGPIMTAGQGGAAGPGETAGPGGATGPIMAAGQGGAAVPGGTVGPAEEAGPGPRA
eukprot:gene3375-13409_t